VIQRGNNREACFYDEADYKAYLAILKDAAIKHCVAIHAFVLMTNHVHLLLTPEKESGTSGMMQSLGRKYVQSLNHTHGRTGTLWEGRYKSTLVDADTYVLTVYRYIELNPVRASMASHASEYPWSSYQANALGKEIELLTPHPTYRRLGKSAAERQSAYRALFRGRMPERDVTAIREATNKAWVLGSDWFKSQVESRTGRRSVPLGRGGDRKSVEFRKSVMK
jgi:putative transposase